jgi:hypothetical protein
VCEAHMTTETRAYAHPHTHRHTHTQTHTHTHTYTHKCYIPGGKHSIIIHIFHIRVLRTQEKSQNKNKKSVFFAKNKV